MLCLVGARSHHNCTKRVGRALFSAAEVDEFAHAAVESAKAGDPKTPSELVQHILASWIAEI